MSNTIALAAADRLIRELRDTILKLSREINKLTARVEAQDRMIASLTAERDGLRREVAALQKKGNK